MAYRTKYKYGVIDKENDGEILKNATLDEVNAKLGVPRINISNYAEKGHLFDRRYLITREKVVAAEEAPEPDSNTINQSKKFTLPPDIIADWDAVCLKLNPRCRDMR